MRAHAEGASVEPGEGRGTATGSTESREYHSAPDTTSALPAAQAPAALAKGVKKTDSLVVAVEETRAPDARAKGDHGGSAFCSHGMDSGVWSGP